MRISRPCRETRRMAHATLNNHRASVTLRCSTPSSRRGPQAIRCRESFPGEPWSTPGTRELGGAFASSRDRMTVSINLAGRSYPLEHRPQWEV
jgi:hypothetical protein